MTQIMLFHIGLWMQTHMSPLVNGPMPLSGYITYEKMGNEVLENQARYRFRGLVAYSNEIKVVNGGKTLIISYKAKNREINRKTQTYFYKWANVMTVGVSIKEDGIVRLWSKQADFYRSLGWEELLREIDVHTSCIPAHEVERVIREFAEMNGAESLEELVMPWVKKLGWHAPNVGMPWAVRVLQSETIGEFWSRLCPKNKLAKDEKRALWAAMEVNPANMQFARLAGLVEIPNLRTVKVDEDVALNDFDRRIVLKSADIKVLAKQLRVIPPQRRVMFFNALLQNDGRTKIIANDTLRMVSRYIGEGVFPEGMNLRSVDEYHNACVRELNREQAERAARAAEQRAAWAAQREAQDAQWRLDNAERWAEMEAHRVERERLAAEAWEKTKKAQEKAFELHGEIIPGTDIEVILPQDTNEPRLWGNEQNHCIGDYVNRMAQGRVILMGFRAKGSWVGHASIEGGLVTQLLAKNNQRLPEEERLFILEYLVEKGVADTTGTRWG